MDKSVHEKSPKSVHEMSPFDNVHEKSPILIKSVHEMSLSTKFLHPDFKNFIRLWKSRKSFDFESRFEMTISTEDQFNFPICYQF